MCRINLNNTRNFMPLLNFPKPRNAVFLRHGINKLMMLVAKQNKIGFGIYSLLVESGIVASRPRFNTLNVAHLSKYHA